MTKKLLTLLPLGLMAGAVALQGQVIVAVSDFSTLDDQLASNEFFHFDKDYLPTSASGQSQNTNGLQAGMSFVLNETLTVTGFVVRVGTGSDFANRTFGYRIWEFQNGPEAEAPFTFTATGNQPFGSDGTASTSTGSLAFANGIAYADEISNGDTLFVRLADPITLTAQAGVRYGFTIVSNDSTLRLARNSGNPETSVLNGFEQQDNGNWRTLGGGGDRVIDFDLVAIPEPSTYAALFGLFALGCVAWRRRHAR